MEEVRVFRIILHVYLVLWQDAGQAWLWQAQSQDAMYFCTHSYGVGPSMVAVPILMTEHWISQKSLLRVAAALRQGVRCEMRRHDRSWPICTCLYVRSGRGWPAVRCCGFIFHGSDQCRHCPLALIPSMPAPRMTTILSGHLSSSGSCVCVSSAAQNTRFAAKSTPFPQIVYHVPRVGCAVLPEKPWCTAGVRTVYSIMNRKVEYLHAKLWRPGSSYTIALFRTSFFIFQRFFVQFSRDFFLESFVFAHPSTTPKHPNP